MNNGDQPAHPTGHSQSGTGLTKREMIAAMAMQGALANYHIGNAAKNSNDADLCKMAVRLADELIKQLSKD